MAEPVAGMTLLAGILARRIATAGPITLAEYMTECLLHPEHGYYTTRTPFGRGGDFITAPEISQMFGELLGLALARSWLDQGCPAPFTLAEIGPGRGTLMVDLLRATRGVPGFHAAARVILLEASPALREVQRAVLGDHPATWLGSVADLPERPLWLIANEFFDALPIRQFLRAPDSSTNEARARTGPASETATEGGSQSAKGEFAAPGLGAPHTAGRMVARATEPSGGAIARWCETLVGLAGDRLAFGKGPAGPVADLAHRLTDTMPDDVVELCPGAPPIMAQIAGRIARHGGAALIIDYGSWRSRGDTFQAVAAHAPTDPLAAPGMADLTAHVDFEMLSLAAASAGAKVGPLTTQGVVLERLGIAQRARALALRLSEEPLANHLAAYRRLTHPQEMGTVFKILPVIAPDAPQLAGFAP